MTRYARAYLRLTHKMLPVIAASFLWSCLLISPALAKKAEQTIENQISNAQAIVLEGFEPSTQIHYTILSATNLIAQSRAQTDANGNLVIKYNKPSEANPSYYVYDFNISKDGNYTNILMRHNLRTGIITTSGNGLDEFSKVSLITSSDKALSKTDWSGAFSEKSILEPEDNEYQVALHGFSAMGEIGKRENSAIIKVLAAPGGGFYSSVPNDTGTMTPTPPSSGGYPISTANMGHITTLSNAIVNNYVRALMLISEQLTAVVMQQTLAIGQFFDAKLQLEAQRTHQALKAEAVKDYHPSDQMCRVGTYVRSLAKTEQKAAADKLALNDVMIERYKGRLMGSSSTVQADSESKLLQYREFLCNPKDNNRALAYLCEHDQNEISADSTEFEAPLDGIGGQFGLTRFDASGTPVDVVTTRFNKDIDYTRTIDFPQTIDIDMNDGALATDEEDVIALAKNLYWPKAINYPTDPGSLKSKRKGYLDTQRVIALKSIAHNSYTNIASLKARAETPPAGSTVEPGWTFMKTLMRDFGITDAEIEQMIGVQPSYWAQMDVLTKKIYQLPNFYTNLYDKPVNVDRMSATLDAIKLMQMRDYYNSYKRSEMLNSALLETELVRGNHYSRAEAATLFPQ